MLLAAKILVLSRRLHKKLSGYPTTMKYVESLRVRLGQLRQKLLEAIDECLAVGMQSSSLVDAMCAFSLATSSSCADVLRHFHHVRAGAISSKLGTSSSPGTAVNDSFSLWVRTIRDVRSMFPLQLSKALAKLKSQPLLQDADVVSCSELGFDVHSVLIDEEVKNFVPYVRYDDLQVGTVAQQVSSWAISTLKKLLAGISASLVGIEQPKNITDLRHEIIQLWLSSSDNLHGVSKKQVLAELRAAFQKKLSQFIEERCENISEIGTFIRNVAEDTTRLEDESRAIPGIWTGPIVRMDLSAGAEPFVEAVNGSYRGYTPAISSTIDRYKEWLGGIDQIRSAIGTMIETHWEDEEDFEDSLSESDEEPSSTPPRIFLNVHDPAELNSKLSSSLKSAFDSFAAVFALPKAPSSPITALKASYLLRALREITSRLPPSSITFATSHRHHPISSSQPDKSPSKPLLPFLHLATPLHAAISSPLIDSLIGRHRTLVQRLASCHGPVAGRTLWEDGTPPLPSMPSPTVFRFLRELHRALETAGPDLWTIPATNILKGRVRDRLAETLMVIEEKHDHVNDSLAEADGMRTQAEIESKGNVKSEEDSDGDKMNGVTLETKTQEASIQRLFDLDLLRAATATEEKMNADAEVRKQEFDGTGDSLSTLRDRWIARLEVTGLGQGVEKSAVALRLENSAAAYWKRSRLLFGSLNTIAVS